MDELWGHVLVLGSAALLGGLLGLERQLRGEWAGLRTHMMVALGAAMFMQAGQITDNVTPAALSRIIQGIAAGIGFIGAGTILKLTDRFEIHGLTTASSIWLAAAIGTACGVRQFGISCVAVVMAIGILYGLRQVESLFDTKSPAQPPVNDNEPKS